MNSLAYTYGDIEDKRVVLLQSGGLDSCVCAHIFKYWDFEVHHVFIDYGQNSVNKERENARKIVEKCGGTLHEVKIDLPWLKEVCKLTAGEEVEDIDSHGVMNTAEEGTYVPMRNAMFLTIASSLAESLNIPYISAALDGSEDVDGNLLCGTTDKHPTFVKKMEDALSNGSVLHHQYGKDFIMLTPVINMFKDEIIKLGESYDTDFSISWSCYNSTEKPCCKCSACRVRAKGFHLAGIEDPVMKKFGLTIPEELLELDY